VGSEAACQLPPCISALASGSSATSRLKATILTEVLTVLNEVSFRPFGTHQGSSATSRLKALTCEESVPRVVFRCRPHRNPPAPLTPPYHTRLASLTRAFHTRT
jgi:hypothetical protein